MTKTTEYLPLANILEDGIDLISNHLRWVLRQSIFSHTTTTSVNTICFCADIPVNKEGKKVWGETHAPSKSICINLEHHFNKAVEMVEQQESINVSLKTILLRELIDTAIHESHHLLIAEKTDNYGYSNLEEEEAKDQAFNESWLIAKKFDIEIKSFGLMLEDLIKEYINKLIKETEEKTEEWKDLQIFMHKNNLAIYNPEKEIKLNIFKAFNALSKEDLWERPEKYVEYINSSEEQKDTSNLLKPSVENTNEEFIQQEAAVIQTPVETTKQTITSTKITAQEITETVTNVLRRLFQHIKIKSGFNNGIFSNPAAVLEYVNISDIPGSENIILMDCADENGSYCPKVNTANGIKGWLNGNNIPMYRLYINFNGTILKRTFMPPKHDGKNSDGEFSSWAVKMQKGTLIMMSIEQYKKGEKDATRIRADIQSDINCPLGQEQVTSWEVK